MANTAKRQKSISHSKGITAVSDKTLQKYYYNRQYQGYSNFNALYNTILDKENCSAEMQSKNIILCESNAGLWDKTATSAVNSITNQSYPHYVVVKELINYVLQAKTDKEFGLVEEFFWKLLLTHPPRQSMFDYYLHILSDHFVILNEKKVEEQNIFLCLLNTLTNLLKSPDDSQFGEVEVNSIQNFKEVINNINCKEIDFSLCKLDCQNSIDFKTLLWKEKVKRCIIILNFVYNIFETNFSLWLESRSLKLNGNRPLISHILWPKEEDVGSSNKQLLSLYKVILQSQNCNPSLMLVLDKLIYLVAEVFRFSDFTEGVHYSFLETNSVNFARELSIHLYERIIDQHRNGLLKENEPLVNSNPPWLRLLLCTYLLRCLTKYECPPELAGACYILEHIAHCKEEIMKKGVKLEENVENFKSKSVTLEASKNEKVAPMKNKNNHFKTTCSHKKIKFKQGHKELVGRLCVEMIQAYFCTHRTWDVHRAFKEKSKNLSGFAMEWDYARYHEDFNNDICKLKKLSPKLSEVQEFKKSYIIYTAILFSDEYY